MTCPLAELHGATVEPAGFTPDIAMFALLERIATTQGAVEMGYAADGFLRGIRMAIAAAVGTDAAYAALQRAADEAAHEIIRNGHGG
jgi:hypothetical protein